MDRIRRLEKKAAARCFVVSLVDGVLLCLVIALIAAFAAQLGAKLSLTPSIDWEIFVWSSLIFTGFSTVGYALWRQPGRASLARMVDEAAGLPQSLGTVHWLAGAASGWAEAVRAQTERSVSRVRASELFPLRMRRRWLSVPCSAVAFGAAFFMPAYDLPAALMSDGEREERAQRDSVEQAEMQVASIEEEMFSIEDGLGEELASLLDEAKSREERANASTPEDVRSRAIQTMSEVGRELDQRLERDASQRHLHEMRKRLADLRESESRHGEMRGLVDAMKRGDFEAAAKSLRDLEEKLSSMNETEREALAAEIRELSAQLAALAEDRRALEEALASAGLPEGLANDLEALKAALEEMQGLTQEQRESLMKLAEQHASACKQCENMSQSLARMQDSMCSGGSCSSSIGEMGAEFSKLARAQSARDELSRMQARLALSMQKLGASPGMCNSFGNRPGGQMGSPFGSGSSEIESAPDDRFTADAQKSPSIDDGSTLVIGRSLIEAGQVRGESMQTFRSVVLSGGRAASRAVEDKQFPREYHDAVQSYFSTMLATPSEATSKEPVTDEADGEE